MRLGIKNHPPGVNIHKIGVYFNGKRIGGNWCFEADDIEGWADIDYSHFQDFLAYTGLQIWQVDMPRPDMQNFSPFQTFRAFGRIQFVEEP